MKTVIITVVVIIALVVYAALFTFFYMRYKTYDRRMAAKEKLNNDLIGGNDKILWDEMRP